MWQCVKCREKIEDNFDACWRCGTTKDGIEDPCFNAERTGEFTAGKPDAAVSTGEPGRDAAESHSVSIADELKKLQELHRTGSLTDEEFTQAKAKVLAGSASATNEQVGQLSEHLAEVRYQNELARLDREWESERQKYYITDRYGRRNLPTSAMGIGTGVVGGMFGLFWTIMACSITGSGPNDGAFGVAKVVFPLFGVVFTVAAIGYGVYCHSRAQEYEKALAAYRRRRNAIRPEQFQ